MKTIHTPGQTAGDFNKGTDLKSLLQTEKQ